MLSADFVEREYNLRAAFPDHPAWLARWADESARARRQLVGELNLRYGSGPKQTIDLFPAVNARGTYFFIHGGYWRALDKDDYTLVAPALVAQGIGVALVNYDLCPDVSIARIVEQCREAVAWLRREGPRHHMPIEPLVIGGHSAGGHLTAILAATDWTARGLPATTMAAGVALSGVFDLEPLVQVSFNVDLKLDRSKAHALSPIHLSLPRPLPLLLAAGADETSEFIRQCWLLWERWPACHLPEAHGPLFVRDRHHFSVVSDLADPNSEIVTATLRLFDNLTGR